MIDVIDAIDETRLRLAEFRRHGLQHRIRPHHGRSPRRPPQPHRDGPAPRTTVSSSRSSSTRPSTTTRRISNAIRAPSPPTLERAESAGADLIFNPKAEDIYHDDYRFRVTETGFSRELEGAHREGHFDGVLTVVLKLLNIVQADRAYFGEKDWQQLELVRDMTAAFFHPTEIIACPIVREPDGLAMSSRNVHLSAEERELAPEFHRILRKRCTNRRHAPATRRRRFRSRLCRKAR